MNKSHLVLATSIGLAARGRMRWSANGPGPGEDSGVPGADGSGSGGSSGSGTSGGGNDSGGVIGADGGMNGCQCAASGGVLRQRGRTGRNPRVLLRGRQRVSCGVSGRGVHQHAGLRRRTAVLLPAQREYAEHDECERVHGVLSGGSTADLHDGRHLPDGCDVRDAIGRRLRFHDLPRDTSLHGDWRLRDGPGLLRGCGRRREHLPDGHELRRRDGPGLRTRRLRRGSGLLRRRHRCGRLEHLPRGHFRCPSGTTLLCAASSECTGGMVCAKVAARHARWRPHAARREIDKSVRQHRLPCGVPRLPHHDFAAPLPTAGLPETAAVPRRMPPRGTDIPEQTVDAFWKIASAKRVPDRQTIRQTKSAASNSRLRQASVQPPLSCRSVSGQYRRSQPGHLRKSTLFCFWT